MGLASSRFLGTHRYRMQDAIRAQTPAAELPEEVMRARWLSGLRRWCARHGLIRRAGR
jgi:hypothetical protein